MSQSKAEQQIIDVTELNRKFKEEITKKSAEQQIDIDFYDKYYFCNEEYWDGTVTKLENYIENNSLTFASNQVAILTEKVI